MAIIINEFEIVQPPNGANGAANGNRETSAKPPAPAQAAAMAAMLQPTDVEEIMRRLLQRRLRVWAD